MLLQSVAMGSLLEAALSAGPAQAVQGLTAGRIPGKEVHSSCVAAIFTLNGVSCLVVNRIRTNVQVVFSGLSSPDEEGFFTYTRPEGKSGGHGVGWSEIPRYSFKVPQGWEETPVSIADLGGTEVSVHFSVLDSSIQDVSFTHRCHWQSVDPHVV
jgi:hypothetical protein